MRNSSFFVIIGIHYRKSEKGSTTCKHPPTQCKQHPGEFTTIILILAETKADGHWLIHVNTFLTKWRNVCVWCVFNILQNIRQGSCSLTTHPVRADDIKHTNNTTDSSESNCCQLLCVNAPLVVEPLSSVWLLMHLETQRMIFCCSTWTYSGSAYFKCSDISSLISVNICAKLDRKHVFLYLWMSMTQNTSQHEKWKHIWFHFWK